MIRPDPHTPRRGAIPMEGKRFGDLLVLHRVPARYTERTTHARVWVRCVCAREYEIDASHVRRGVQRCRECENAARRRVA